MLNKFQGCLIGLALGDALCAPFEGGIVERKLWKIIGATKNNKIRYTDDTQMTLDVAYSLIQHKGINQDALAKRFADSYQWSRGYGSTAAKLLKGIKKGKDWRKLNKKYFKEGSFGNGAAMRVAPIALAYYKKSTKQLFINAKKTAVITHAHPDAIIGTYNIAFTIAAMLKGKHESFLKQLIAINHDRYQYKLELARDWVESEEEISKKDIIFYLGNSIQAIDSTVTAIYLALRFINSDFLDMINFIQQLGGDTDTIAAMSGAIWGAKNGLDAIKYKNIEQLESFEKILLYAQELSQI